MALFLYKLEGRARSDLDKVEQRQVALEMLELRERGCGKTGKFSETSSFILGAVVLLQMEDPANLNDDFTYQN